MLESCFIHDYYYYYMVRPTLPLDELGVIYPYYYIVLNLSQLFLSPC
ncbi:hypothetical protein MtrunA17_Chr3g0133131 [Medicago truncatula]|uniref:Uncharacterized protein n=1 Tax=Medicago truncatula TaxID=3880 RepID=A0A396J0J4_MEDTR|nr:hypothetical protein MtrunA17_Chr3g0133131 [Medicago truncatula]